LFVTGLLPSAQNAFCHAVYFTARELELTDYITFYDLDFVSFAATPYMDVYNTSRPGSYKAGMSAPFFKLSLGDIERLESDTAKRQRYTELVSLGFGPHVTPPL
jgi:hypothetical protein